VELNRQCAEVAVCSPVLLGFVPKEIEVLNKNAQAALCVSSSKAVNACSPALAVIQCLGRKSRNPCVVKCSRIFAPKLENCFLIRDFLAVRHHLHSWPIPTSLFICIHHLFNLNAASCEDVKCGISQHHNRHQRQHCACQPSFAFLERTKRLCR
jgi:hypothetical protein